MLVFVSGLRSEQRQCHPLVKLDIFTTLSQRRATVYTYECQAQGLAQKLQSRKSKTSQFRCHHSTRTTSVGDKEYAKDEPTHSLHCSHHKGSDSIAKWNIPVIHKELKSRSFLTLMLMLVSCLRSEQKQRYYCKCFILQPRRLAAPHCKGSYFTSFYHVAEQFNPFQKGWELPLEAHRELCLLCTCMAINPLSSKGLGRAQHFLAVLAEPRHCMMYSGMAAWATLLDMVYIASKPKQQILTTLAAKELSFGSRFHCRIAHAKSVCSC